jgi:protein AFG1
VADAPRTQTKLFISSEVPIFQIFSDDGGGGEISSHQRAIMDDLVRPVSESVVRGADARQGLPAGVVGASSLFTGDEELFAFARCCSRLVEMGSVQWAESAREA